MLRIAKGYMKLHGVKLKQGLQMYSLPLCRRHPLATIEIGSGVIIRNKLRENIAGISHRSVFAAVRPNARLVIGDHVGISGVIIYCTEEIIVGDHVNLGIGVRIYDTDFHPIDADARRRNEKNIINSAPIRIHDDAWIGANAIILKGVTVGARSIVGAGAVVARDVPSDTIVAGNPARVVKTIVFDRKQP